MACVVVTGAAGSVGSRVVARLCQEPTVERVIGIDRHPLVDPAAIEMRTLDLAVDDLDSAFEMADVVVHLASVFGPSSDGRDVSGHDVLLASRVLDAADRSPATRVIVLSSAMVYGAYDTNPIPLTEQAAARPNAGFAFAAAKLEVERHADAWADGSRRSVTVLRPTTAVAAGESSWVARTMRASASLGSDSNPPVQFLQLDDLASAVVHAVVARPNGAPLAGVYNVAPDGWVRGDEVRQLSGRAPRLQLPTAVAGQIAETSWRHRLAPTPPGIVPYTTQPWVIANDKLRATGWEPSFSNVEAYVEGHNARPWAMMNSKRRQQVALVATGVAAAAAAALAAFLWRRLRPID